MVDVEVRPDARHHKPDDAVGLELPPFDAQHDVTVGVGGGVDLAGFSIADRDLIAENAGDRVVAENLVEIFEGGCWFYHSYIIAFRVWGRSECAYASDSLWFGALVHLYQGEEVRLPELGGHPAHPHATHTLT